MGKLYSDKLETLIDATLLDGRLTDKERQALFNRAKEEDIDLVEFEVYLESRLYEVQQKAQSAPAVPKTAPAAVPPPITANAPRKMGSMVKCPVCGEPVVYGNAKCKACGYAFVSDVNAESPSQKFKREFEKRFRYLSENKAPDAIEFIGSYPVKSLRGDLLDMLAMSKSLAKPWGPQDGLTLSEKTNLSYGYWCLYRNCIDRAKNEFANDSSFKGYFEWYEKQAGRLKPLCFFNSLSHSLRAGIMYIGFLFGLFVFCMVLANA